MSFNVGENIGPYRIIEQLGQGGMATVYKAYHAALDRYVALKVLHAAFGEDPNFEARFRREARVVAKLEHPNIVPIYDYSEHEKQPFLVMKFIEGETLKARMARGPLTTEELELIIRKVGAALSYAHRAGILHRDIKPSNVLLAADGSIYLADFGLARIAAAGESTLSGDTIMGTPQYISPEQAMGKKDLDEGTDIYSFGVMLYEMVVGQVPFNADTPFSIIHDHIYTPLPIPHVINPGVPESVERVLLKALAKNRADRYQTVDDMTVAFIEGWRAAGVPMKGTTITVRPKAPPVSFGASVPSIPLTSSVPSAPSTPKFAPNAATMSKSASEAIPAKKAGVRWPAILASVLVLAAFCFLGLLAVRSIRRRGGLVLRRTPTAVPSQVQATSTRVQPVEPTGSVPPPTQPPLSLEFTPTPNAAILDARRVVAQNPDDPAANLQLALAYWDGALPQRAYQALNRAANLAPPDDRGFFLDAAQQFAQREAWIAVAALYIRAIKTQPPGPIPPDLETPFHEAVYKAAPDPDLPNLLPFDSIARIDQSIALVAQGRAVLASGDTVAANDFLAQAKSLNPNMPEPRLLEAEIRFKEGQRDTSRQILILLTSEPTIPDWIRKMADQYLLQYQ